MVHAERGAVIGFEQVVAIAVAAPEAPQLLRGEGEAEDVAAAFGQRARSFLDHVGMGDEHVGDEIEQVHHPLFGGGEAFGRGRSHGQRRRGFAADPVFGRHIVGIEAEQGVQQGRARARRPDDDQRRLDLLPGDFGIGLAVGDQPQPRHQLVGQVIDHHPPRDLGHAVPAARVDRFRQRGKAGVAAGIAEIVEPGLGAGQLLQRRGVGAAGKVDRRRGHRALCPLNGLQACLEGSSTSATAVARVVPS